MMRLLLTVLLLTSMPLYSAGPVVHVYFAGKFFELYPKYTDKEKEQFIIGTLFPDIRYVSHLNRADTHDEEVTIAEILEQKSPFDAGMKFHAWVDHVRDEYVLGHRTYDKLPSELTKEQKPSFLKVIEDELLLDDINADFCCKLLEGVLPEELEQGATEREVELWHAFLVFFFKTSPRTTVTLLSMIDTKSSYPSKDDMEKWTSLINPTIQSSFGINHAKDLVEHITKKMIEEQPSNNESTIMEIPRDGHTE